MEIFGNVATSRDEGVTRLFINICGQCRPLHYTRAMRPHRAANFKGAAIFAAIRPSYCRIYSTFL